MLMIRFSAILILINGWATDSTTGGGGWRHSNRPDLLTEYGCIVCTWCDGCAMLAVCYERGGGEGAGVGLFCVRDSRRESEPQMDGCHVMVERALDERARPNCN